MLSEADDVLHGDLLVELPLMLRVLEAESCEHQVARVELADCDIAEEGADEGIFKLAADLLENDSTLIEDAAILFGYLGGLLLSHYFEKLFHVIKD